ncbi:TetR/AcrR family transcriptional regulator [Telmatospirillum sp. J64-1]|uniref:TetR/AcrR family transcriptional regulator n=1 Tax=Telmatospirillum sp. J64-1 TaxID=2502183 RepID=UPI00115DD34B|nr:TetR/AcrR family transcriptional regulator [Telmatospirillum sp. J64-1]
MSQEKRARLREKATRLFLEKGYDRVTIDDVIQEAGGSKTTLYTYFGGKEGLFAEIIEHQCRMIREAVTIPSEGVSPREALRQLGRNFLHSLILPDLLGLHRLVIHEAERFPDLAKHYFEAGPELIYQAVAKHVSAAQEAGLMKPLPPRQAAGMFLHMLAGQVHLALILGVRPPPEEEEIDRLVDDAVDIFLNGSSLSGKI